MRSKCFTYFIKETNQASKNGINFTDKETDAILEVLKAEYVA